MSFNDAQLAEKRPADVQYAQLTLLPHRLPSAGSAFGQVDGFEGRLGADHLHWSDDPQEVGPSRCKDGAQYAHVPSNVQPCGWVHDCPGDGGVPVQAGAGPVGNAPSPAEPPSEPVGQLCSGHVPATQNVVPEQSTHAVDALEGHAPPSAPRPPESGDAGHETLGQATAQKPPPSQDVQSTCAEGQEPEPPPSEPVEVVLPLELHATAPTRASAASALQVPIIVAPPGSDEGYDNRARWPARVLGTRTETRSP